MCSPFGTTSKHLRRREPLSKVEHLTASGDTGCCDEVRGGDISSPGLEAHVVVWRGDNSPSRLCGKSGRRPGCEARGLIVLARVARHLKSPNDDGLDKAAQAAQLFSIEGVARIQKYSLTDMGTCCVQAFKPYVHPLAALDSAQRCLVILRMGAVVSMAGSPLGVLLRNQALKPLSQLPVPIAASIGSSLG
jgi:hypothetical protein